MKSLDKFAGLEISNTEEVKGGTFGFFSLSSLCAPKQPVCYTPAPKVCYTPPPTSCNNGGYSNNNCSPKPKPTSCFPSFSFSFSFGGCK